MSEQKNIRRYIRFRPEGNLYAQLDTQADRDAFSFEYVALILDEAPLGGCGLAAHKEVKLVPGDLCRLKIGQLAPLKAEVVWKRILDEEIVRFGFKFLE